ncbi:MAG TPA: restriction endonuclease [Spirochaetota bacterium]|nr:restriction endonuclease [Spirochaetota bacterium]
MLITFILIILGGLGVVGYYLVYIRPKFDPVRRAELFEKQGMLKESVLEYRKVLENRPGDPTAHYRLAGLYMGLNEIDQAIIQFEELLRIGKFTYEIEPLDVQKKLAHAYYLRDDVEKAFRGYLEILGHYPADAEALYHVAFIAMGQEEFDFAQKHFDRLVKISRDDFEVFFGAGITSYQNQKTNEAINYFKSALALRPNSDAANLAMAFALQRKRDFKQAIPHASAIADRAQEFEVRYVARRLLAFLKAQSKKSDEAVKCFEELLQTARENDSQSEIMLALYDLGYACIRAEQVNKAYEYWNELYRIDKTYNEINRLVTMLRREMDSGYRQSRDDFEASVMDGVDDWIAGAFPPSFIWDICGLKSDRPLDIKSIMVTTRIGFPREGEGETRLAASTGDRLEKLVKLDTENFRIMASRVITKMGYRVEQILQTYREADGVDFMATSNATKEKVLVWFRRWTKTMVGEIPLRNFAQAINDFKVKQGLFVTTVDLTEPAKNNLGKLQKVMVVYPDELDEYLKGIL